MAAICTSASCTAAGVVDPALAEAAENSPEDIEAAFSDSTFASAVASRAQSAVSQVLGLTSSAGFLAMYNNSLTSGVSGLLSILYSNYL